MVERQDVQNQDWGAEEKNYNCERDGYVVKGVQKNLKDHFNECPSNPMEDAHPKTKPTSTNRFVGHPFQSVNQDKSPGQVCETKYPNSRPRSRQGLKDCIDSINRKKRRPQSLNLGGPAKLICRNRDTDSSSSGEENQDPYLEDPQEQSSIVTGNYCESSVRLSEQDWDGSDAKEYLSVECISEQRGSQPGLMATDPDYPELANCPEKPTSDMLFVGLKEVIEAKIQKKALIVNKELAEVKLRQVRTYERRVGSFGGEDTEGLVGRTSIRRLSGSSSGRNFPGEITRIVPLKPERSKSVAYKDKRDKVGPEELTSRFLRREYRWSVESSVEGATDLLWSEAHDSATEVVQLGRGCAEGQSLTCKIALPAKTVPPAPPVKTQKARESGLILRNSRSAGLDSSDDAAQKRHSVTLSSASMI